MFLYLYKEESGLKIFPQKIKFLDRRKKFGDTF
jgi:hypothetical protein